MKAKDAIQLGRLAKEYFSEDVIRAVDEVRLEVLFEEPSKEDKCSSRQKSRPQARQLLSRLGRGSHKDRRKRQNQEEQGEQDE